MAEENNKRILNAEKIKEWCERDADQLYRVLVEELTDIFYITDKDGNFLYISPQIEKLGTPAKDFWGKNALDLIAEEDREEMKNRWKKVFETGKVTNPQFRIKDKDGKVYWWMVKSKVKFNDRGEMIGMFGAMYEISEIKNKEEELAKHAEELEKFKKLVLDRELKMVELKKEIEALKGEKKTSKNK